MQKTVFYIAVLIVVLSSCKLTEDNIVGTYQQKGVTTAKLILKKDRTFEFIGREPGSFASNPPSTNVNPNFITSGTWKLKNKQIWLNSAITDSLRSEEKITDSIARFTSITAFNFWNRYGDPVSIRSIFLPPAKTKPHFGNSLYLFAQDFNKTDTVIFHFDGYPDFVYPGSVPYSIGNNMHKIILREPYRPAVFNNSTLLCKKNKILLPGDNIAFIKKK